MAVNPMEILREVNPQSVPADAPPDVANYRDAEMQGIACAFCAKFSLEGFRPRTGDGDNMGLPVGYCHQWESNVDGWGICNSYASGMPSFDQDGREVWDMDDSPMMAEIHFATGAVEESEGFVVKEILRTGEWPVIPTAGGMVKKPLKVIRDGTSSKEDGVIAISELMSNFKAGIPQRVQVPLSDEDNDHKNTTRLNTGFVRDLWILDETDTSKLVAKIQFTEPDVRDKVLRGTYDDVSCGIPWNMKVRGQQFGACLEHVCITNRPFIDGLGPFLAMSDGDQHVKVEIAHFGAVTAPGTETDESQKRDRDRRGRGSSRRGRKRAGGPRRRPAESQRAAHLGHGRARGSIGARERLRGHRYPGQLGHRPQPDRQRDLDGPVRGGRRAKSFRDPDL